MRRLAFGCLLPCVALAAACSPSSRGAAVSTAPLSVADVVPLLPLSAGVEAGTSVSLDGDLLVVGAPRDGDLLGAPGAAYVFARDAGGAGAWGLVARLEAPDANDGDAFGAAVAVSGDVVAVGAPQRATGGLRDAGAAYVFLRNLGGTDAFGFAALLTAATPAADASFGAAAAASGDDVAVSAVPQSPRTGTSSVHVFGRNAGGTDAFGLVARLTSCATSSTSFFGRSVSISGDLLASGDIVQPSLAGSACVFARDQGGADAWGLVKQVALPEAISNTAWGDDFGDAVSISGDTLAVGAWGRNEAGQVRSGAAYVFRRDAGGAGAWGLVRKVVASAPAPYDVFGSVLSLSGDVLAVAAPRATGAASHGGAVWIYERNRGGTEAWGLAKKISPSLASWGAEFGGSVAASAGRVAIGATLADLAAPDSGAATLYVADQGGTGAWGEVAERVAAGTLVYDRRVGVRTSGTQTSGSQFGLAVAASGDLVLVGGPTYPLGGSAEAGAAWLFSRDAGGAGAFGGLGRLGVRDGGESVAYSWIGHSVAISGDVAVVGASKADLVGSDSGAAFVFLRDGGGADAWGQAAVLRAPDAAASQKFGSAVAADGELVAVAVPSAAGGGKVHLFGRNQGGADAFGLVKTLVAPDAAAGDAFGTSLAIAGDALVVGAPDDDDDGSSSGSVYVFLRDQGGAGAWGLARKLRAPDGVAGARFGAEVAAAGDVLAAGAPQRTEAGLSSAGAAYVFLRDLGGAAAYGLAKKLLAPQPTAGTGFGGSMAAGPGLVAVRASNTIALFARSLGGPTEFGLAATLANPSTGTYGFGALALSGSLLLVGRYGVSAGYTSEGGEAWAVTLADGDDCDAAPCKHGATCTDLVGGFTCACAPGYLGADCSFVDACSPNPCQHEGTCTNGTEGPVCTCPTGFTGPLCATVDPCLPSPCLNGGTCSAPDGLATCTCAPGYAGATCETNVDDCAPNPCLNGGTCADLVSGFSCTCVPGFTGATCQTNVDDCASSPCQNGGTCTDLVNGFSCTCPAGWSGATCATADPCAPNPCQNGGACSAPAGAAVCACAPGFTGATCDTDVDDCASTPCLHGGLCADGANAFTCECVGGFTGATCADDVDECALGTDGCSPNATCANTAGSYTCACNAGFSGDGTTCVADGAPPDPPAAPTDPAGGGGCGCGTRGTPTLDVALLALAAALVPRARFRRAGVARGARRPGPGAGAVA